MLNTFSNFGFTWPQYFIFKLVDFFTVAQCQMTQSEGDFTTATVLAPDCLSDDSKKDCLSLGGECHELQDGYYGAAILCFVVGLTLFTLFINKTMMRLQLANISEWRQVRSPA